MGAHKSPLHQTVSTTPTEFWNDSCCVKELTYAIENGATGATSNPTIVRKGIAAESIPRGPCSRECSRGHGRQ